MATKRRIIGPVVIAALSIATALTALLVFTGPVYLIDPTDRCLRSAPQGMDESQAEVITSLDYLRGKLTCTWTNDSGTRKTSVIVPLYQRD